MTKDIIKRIHFLYGIVVSAVTVIAGICLMTACYGIYISGDQPYSREAVAAAFAPISLPVYLCLVLVVVGLLMDLLIPLDSEKVRAPRQDAVILNRLQVKTDLDKCEESLRSAIRAQRRNRKTTKFLSILIKVLAAVIFLVYAVNPDHYHQSDITGSMISAMYTLIPCLIVVFIDAVFTIHFCADSMRKEIDLLKQAGPEAKIAPDKKPAKNNAKFLTAVRCVILCAAAVSLIYGFVNGGTADVLTKAINICTECIGLG